MNVNSGFDSVFPDVALTSAQQAEIARIAANIGPKRAGAAFTEAELGIATAITQVANNGESGMMEALLAVFSQERARAILDEITGVEPVFIGNNCG